MLKPEAGAIWVLRAPGERAGAGTSTSRRREDGEAGVKGARAPGAPGLRAGWVLGRREVARVQGVPAEAPAPLLTSPNWKAETMVTTTPTKQT